jgi:biotin carboxyl carrier protein
MAEEIELIVADEAVTPPQGWSLAWVDRDQGVAMLRHGGEHELVAIEGRAGEWVAIVRGRRVPVTVRSHRDRLLAEATGGTALRGGATEVRATLPGLVVRLAVTAGDEVAAGDPLVTIEAMKMQNEIRAPRDGRVAAVTVEPGQAITSGALLVRLAEPDP